MRKLTPAQRRVLVDQALATKDQDTERFLRRLRDRMDGCGREWSQGAACIWDPTRNLHAPSANSTPVLEWALSELVRPGNHRRQMRWHCDGGGAMLCAAACRMGGPVSHGGGAV